MAIGKSRYKTINLYLSQDFLFSFLVCFLFFFFIFFVNELLVYAEQILSKNVPVKFVLLFLVYAIPSVMALSFPFATLVSTLMSFGRLTSDNEILAMVSTGISKFRIFLPILLWGIVFSFISFFINDYLLPLGFVKRSELYREILFKNPELELQPYSVIQYDDNILITGDVSGNRIENLTIIEKNKENKRRIIVSDSATLDKELNEKGIISFQMDSIVSHTSNSRDKEETSFFHSRGMIYNFLFKDFTYSAQNVSAWEMRAIDVWAQIQGYQKEWQSKESRKKQETELEKIRLYQRYNRLIQLDTLSHADKLRLLWEQYEKYEKANNKPINNRLLKSSKLAFFQKFSIPFSCLPFVIFAFPLGLFARKSGGSVGFGVGLFISILYWGLLFAGRAIGERTDFSPFLVMFFPNLLILFIGIILLINRLKQ